MLTQHLQGKEISQLTAWFERVTILMIYLNAFLLLLKNKCRMTGFVPRSFQLHVYVGFSSELVIQHHLSTHTRQD